MFPKKLRKAFAAFFLVLMIQSAIAPAVSYALTAGPTAPEATSFEPVDTTDMVDLKTGDFTYNIPLLEVPGPAGSYPLSLSYHAGIQPDQEASWTGLGWSLNPGSITRLVNGYPDDHYNVTNVDRSFWEGGETETYQVGVSVGIAYAASVSAGLSFAQDTYRGFGVGGYVGGGVGYRLTNNASLGVNGQFGISPYGDPYFSGGVSLGVGLAVTTGMNLGANIGLSANTASGIDASAGGGVSWSAGRDSNGNSFGGSLIDVSISSGGIKPSLSVGGIMSGVYNSKSGNVSISSEGDLIELPVYYNINLRLAIDYQRYWIDESAAIQTFGSLYLRNVQPNFISAFDTYDLLDTSVDMDKHDDPEKVLGGSFPDVDFYTVAAQGVSGNIRPYHFQKHLYRQDKKDLSDKVLIKNYSLGTVPEDKPVEFRFINDFSNRLEYNPGDFQIAPEKVSFEFGDDMVTGIDGHSGYENNHLAGSNHVEWYTNHEIVGSNPAVNPFREGFINCVAEGFQRQSDNQIGGYSITNASGVTYHYALPVYSYDEFMKTVNTATEQQQNGLSYNSVTKPEKYAYTWYLTAVTGPDYVDRNSNHLADEGDWGYWVNFEYTKWLQDYKWRNPGEGFNRDIDGDFEFFSTGKKEIYYLDKIKTESHVALFQKSERFDGREVRDGISGGFAPIDYVKTPGRQTCESNCESQYCQQQLGCDNEGLSNCMAQCGSLPEDEIAYIIPRPFLKLDKIKLFNYGDFVSGHTSDEFVLRAINFEHGYTLAPGTPNSYTNDDFDTKLGKLTLRSVSFLGKGNLSLVPPMVFGYKNEPYQQDKKDVWGFYKSDFDPVFRDQTNEVIGRATTGQSSLHVDAWSMDSIATSLGAVVSIQYESDRYKDVVLAKQQVLRVKDVTDFAPDKLKLTFWEQGMNLAEYFEPGKPINIDLIGSFFVKRFSKCVCQIGNEGGLLNDTQLPDMASKLFNGKVVVDDVDSEGQYIIVSGTEYYNWLKSETKKIDVDAALGGPNGVFSCVLQYSAENAWPDYFPAGLVSFPEEQERYGGGLRVRTIGLTGHFGNGRKTNYEYEEGTTSYEPYQILAPKINPGYPGGDHSSIKFFYKRAILKSFYKQIGIARHIPGPGVMYKHVNVREREITSDGKEHAIPNFTRYEFETFQEGMVDVVRSALDPIDATTNPDFNSARLNTVTLVDFSSRVGDLKSITLYDSLSNQKVSQTINHYLYDSLDGSLNANITEYRNLLSSKFSNQGLVEETFTRARVALFEEDEVQFFPGNKRESLGSFKQLFYFTSDKRLLGTISKLETFPSVAIGQTSKNYKTGVSTYSETLKYDFYSGQPVEVVSSDSYGNRYLSVTVPAYHKYGEMGLKVLDKRNKQMLTQTAAQSAYLVDAQNSVQGLLSASTQTWSKTIPMVNVSGDIPGIWKKKSSYQWNGTEALNNNGTYPKDDFLAHPFNWSNPDADDHWEKTSEVTLTDIYSHALEAKDINGHFASSRFDKDQRRVIASAVNAAYDEMGHSGAEYSAGNTHDEGGIDRGQGIPATAFAHTGRYSLMVPRGVEGFNYTLPSRKNYKASVWVYAPGLAETQNELSKIQLYYRVNGVETKVSPVVQKSKSKSWYLLSIDIYPGQSGEVRVGVRNNAPREVYFDDFRIHPLDASLTAYVYDISTGELTYILDGNNFYTKFEYDAMGRLVRTKKELLNFDFGDGKESHRADVVLNEYKYNYGKD